MPDVVLRILQRESGQVLLVTRVRDLVHVPINDEGYVGSVRGMAWTGWWRWDFFTGGNRSAGDGQVSLRAQFSFISEKEVVGHGLRDMGEDALIAMTTGG